MCALVGLSDESDEPFIHAEVLTLLDFRVEEALHATEMPGLVTVAVRGGSANGHQVAGEERAGDPGPASRS